jgi:hypothetical protein
MTNRASAQLRLDAFSEPKLPHKNLHEKQRSIAPPPGIDLHQKETGIFVAIYL